MKIISTRPWRLMKRFFRESRFLLECKKKNSTFSKAKILWHNFDKISVGENCWVNNAVFDAHASITIGNNVFFGESVKILTGSHDYTKFGLERQRAITPKPVVIEEGAWIASFAIVMPGTHIGRHAVVSAGSVVRGIVEPYTVVAGNPAKVIKKIAP